MEFEEAMQSVGEFGVFQCLHFFLLSFPVAHTAVYMMTYVFAARDIPYRCYVPECDGMMTSPEASPEGSGPEELSPQLDPPWLAWTVPPSPTPRPWPRGRAPDTCLRYAPRTDDPHGHLQGHQQGHLSSEDGPFGVGSLPESTAAPLHGCSPAAFDTNTTVHCDQWVFPEYERTVVSEFNITCEDNRWRLTAVGSLNFFGQLLGMPFSGVYSDRFGRRGLLLIAVPLSWASGMARSFATSYDAFLVFEFIDAFAASGIYSACFILGVELVAERQRVVGNSVVASFYSMGCALLGAISWVQGDWRWMIRLAYIPAGLSILGVWLLPESVRWLLSRQRFHEAQTVLKRVATINGVSLTTLRPLRSPDQPNNDSATGSSQSSAKISSWPLLQVLSSGLLFRRLFLTAVLWVVNSFVYFGLALRSVVLAGDLHLNFILAALVEIPSYVVAWFVSERWGRRVCVSAALGLTGASLLAFLVMPTGMLSIQLFLYLTGKLAITASFTALYIFTAELFPTNARHSMIGVCSTVGRMGSTLAPQTPLLEVFFWGMPILVFGLMCVGGAFIALLLPETLNETLPDTVTQAKAVGRSVYPPPTQTRRQRPNE